ncbi:MAG: FprA family A-type flavoprotein [candidate division WOR-3 bacterium]|uniref:FprA family A-type flavoprotein n=1 Tax=candidate division WOR-3 bacterium TaxID=2052148 RepID=A0A7C1T1V4_UNCW3|nr:FprA family A-type flavoprotein [candidate division WOR-3 bacterium]
MEFKAVKLTDDVYWVGAVDWNIRDFHGYSTEKGTTYNAYLILADRVTLIDTVKAPFKQEMLTRIASVIDPGEISYIISNHAEMDHSGALPQVITELKPERVFASVMGVKALSEHYHLKTEITALKDGDELSLGNMKLKFFETRMLHWPDSMITYLGERNLLFSQDGFGMHLASGERFADQIEEPVLKWEAAKYYANILLPYSPLVLKLAERLSVLDIRPEIIAPDHGPVWRSNDNDKIIGWYQEWARQLPQLKVVIVYDTMWQSTDLMARAIADGVAEAGLSVKVMRLRATDRSDVMTEVLDAGAVIVGSPTLNNGMFPTVADFLTYMKGLKPKNKIGAAFGSYGWSGEATEMISTELKSMGIELPEVPLRVKYVPDQDALARCWEFGRRMAELVKERVEE